MISWSQPELVFASEQAWEVNRIGGSTPPLRRKQGWLVFYHGVETTDARTKRVCYRMGAVLLDLDDPRHVLGRTRQFIMEPQAYYERFGLVMPDVISPPG